MRVGLNSKTPSSQENQRHLLSGHNLLIRLFLQGSQFLSPGCGGLNFLIRSPGVSISEFGVWGLNFFIQGSQFLSLGLGVSLENPLIWGRRNEHGKKKLDAQELRGLWIGQGLF